MVVLAVLAEAVFVAAVLDAVEEVVTDEELVFDEVAIGFNNTVLDAPDEIALINMAHSSS